MDTHIPTARETDLDIYVRMSKLFSSKFEKELYSETIIQDMMNELPRSERTYEAENAAKDVVFHRQLIKERFT